MFRYTPAPAKTHCGLAYTSQSNMKMISTALAMYVEDEDGHFPLAKSMHQVRASLYPYMKDTHQWQRTGTHGPIQFNTAISGESAHKLESPGATVTLFSTPGFNDDGRWVAFADMAVKNLNQDQWSAVAPILRHRQTKAIRHE